ncbi:hypothetical protein D3C74_266040 [compost metagenome]
MRLADHLDQALGITANGLHTLRKALLQLGNRSAFADRFRIQRHKPVHGAI